MSKVLLCLAGPSAPCKQAISWTNGPASRIKSNIGASLVANLFNSLFNYVENAIRFTESGCVRVIVSTVEDSDDNSLLKFTVEDTGIGISAEVIPQLFQLFQQADNSMTRKFGGTGAGLYITKRIAQLMGGDAGCTSQLAQGSIFWFTIQLKNAVTLKADRFLQSHR